MKTEDLVRALATGIDATAAVDRHAVARRLGVALVPAVALALLVLVQHFGINPRLSEAAGAPMFWVKVGFVLALLAASALLAARLARPGATLGAAGAGVLVLPLLLWMLALVVLAGAAPEERLQLVKGATWSACPWNIALLSLPPFVCGFVAMRSLAPTRLRLAGAAVGLLAGAVGASVYALHCPELAAPFLAVWYVLGILLPVAAGALIGPRVLRW